MKHFVLFSVTNLFLIISPIAQNKDKKQNLPKENSKVTKEYDEKGNLTKFDSVYSYSWSSDTTILKPNESKDFQRMFGHDFDFFSDSAFSGNSFFNNLDQIFANPFNEARDSIFVKQFNHFHDLQHPEDSTAFNFNNLNDFLSKKWKHKTDSISSKLPQDLLMRHPKTMDNMMQIIQSGIQEMEENQRKLFQNRPKQ